nr:uncharacterized protein LOC133578294 isoform X1 [Nerophis lumbriciformis]
MIIETKYSILTTSGSREKMNGENWDSDEEVQVPWPLNKAGGRKQSQTKYVARILRFGEDTRELTPYLKAAQDGKDVPLTGDLEYGRGKRNKQPKSWSSDSESKDESVEETLSDRQQKKKRKESRTAVGYDARAQLKAQLAALGRTSPKDTCTEMESLKKEVLQLREENKSLRDALRVVEGLPGLLMKMDDLSRQATILSARRPAVALPERSWPTAA